jgi:competence protein ComEC
MNWWVLKRRVHTSWFIAMLSMGVVAGVIFAQYIDPTWANSTAWLMGALGLMGIGLWRHKVYALPFLLIAGGMVGLWRGSLGQQELAPYASLIGYEATVTGAITEDPDLGKNGELVLRLSDLGIDNHSMAGNIWVSAAARPDIKRGDIVTLKGKLSEGFGSFVASMYRAEIVRAQRPQPGDIAGRVRDWFAGGVRAAVAEPEASLGIGYLVGQRRSLPPELDEALQIAGLTHIVVASGYNLTILVRMARRLFVKVSKYMAAFSAGGMIVAFSMVTGMSPSMSRAGLVAGLSLLAWYYGRKFHPLVLLPMAAAVTLLVNPSFGWNDLGWQLSFAAFAGVMIVAPLAQRYFFGDTKPGTIRQILGETMAAQLCTLPILILAFGQFSNVAILANILVLPLVPLAMLLTFIAGVGTLALPSLSDLFGVPAQWLLGYMTSVAQYMAGVPWAQTTLAINGIIVGIVYMAIVAACLYMWRKTRYNLRESNVIE